MKHRYGEHGARSRAKSSPASSMPSRSRPEVVQQHQPTCADRALGDRAERATEHEQLRTAAVPELTFGDGLQRRIRG